MYQNALFGLHGGLSDMGRRVVLEMNRIGLYVLFRSMWLLPLRSVSMKEEEHESSGWANSCLSLLQDDRPLAYDGRSTASGFGDIGCSSDIFSLVLVPPSLSSRARASILTDDSKLRIMSSSSKCDRPSPPTVENQWRDSYDLFPTRTLAIAFFHRKFVGYRSRSHHARGRKGRI